jgi:hypothetical protein
MPLEDFGTYKDGSSVYKDKHGYYIYQWDIVKEVEYKKYLKNWKPPKSDTRLILDKKTKKWKIVKSKMPKMPKKSKKTKKSRKSKSRKSKTKKR